MRTTAPRRLATIGAALAVLAVVAPGSASARTLTVDDDKAQCPAAPYTEIQAAVDAAVTGDRVNVCPGTYPEQVHLDSSSRRNVSLVAYPRRQAVLEPPASIPDDAPAPQVRLAEQGSSARGFVFAGELPEGTVDQCASGPQAHARMEAALTSLLDSRFEDVTGGCENVNGYAAVVVQEFNETSLSRGSTIAGNELEDVEDLAILVFSGMALIQNNHLENDGKSGIGIQFGEQAGGLARLNSVGGFAKGLGIQNAFRSTELGPVRAVGNTFLENGHGVESFADNGASMVIESNTLRRNDYGISMGMNSFTALEPGGTVAGNHVLDSAVNGIEMGAAFFRVRDNIVLRSGNLDCRDLVAEIGSTASVWTNNKGLKDSPPTLCRP